MQRPYFHHSIGQLENEYAKAAANGSSSAMENIAHELTFRNSTRAKELARTLMAKIPNSTAQAEAQPLIRKSAGVPSEPQRNRRSQRSGSRNAPTREQSQAIEAFLKGKSLKINAYAGAGKTSTLEMLAHSTPGRGQYIAFNKKIVEDSKDRFPDRVDCSTSHSIAFKATPSEYRQVMEKMTGKINLNQLAEILGLKNNWRIDEHHTLRPRSQAFIIDQTVRRFTQSADGEPHRIHVPMHGAFAAATESTIKIVEDFAVRGAKHVWARMLTPNDPIPLGFDGFLKRWALTSPQLAADYILLDEAQDTNPVVLDVLRNQSAQMIYVGDKYQQIYEWRGAINAMETIQTDATTLLTMSFRFGETIAMAASKVLSELGEPIAIKGNPKIQSRLGPTSPRAILARTNGGAITAVIGALDSGQCPHLVGGTTELMEMLRGVQDLKNGQPSVVPEFFGFPNWRAVVDFAKSGEGDHLLTFVNLVESRGEKQLMWALGKTVDEEDRCHVVVSTAHKAKGREWDKVRLMDDFLKSTPGKSAPQNKEKKLGPDPAELRLFYVAMTRAREEIEIPPPMMQRFSMVTSLHGQPLPQRSDQQSFNSFEQPAGDGHATTRSATLDWKPPTNSKPTKIFPATDTPIPEAKRGFFKRLFG